MAGDQYLQFFADHAVIFLKDNGGLYRMAGDEFTCLFTGERQKAFLKELYGLSGKSTPAGIPFIGCSAGCSHYPEDAQSLDKLLLLADQEMYRAKQRTCESTHQG